MTRDPMCRWSFAIFVWLSGFPSYDFPSARAFDPATCQRALGMQSGSIPDAALTASSSHDEASVGPTSSRIRTEKNGGAWCPKQTISTNVYEWIQIDLGEIKAVTKIETQGRFGNGQGIEFAEHFSLEYLRLENSTWKKFKDFRGNEVFLGNVNTFEPELRNISPPIVARKIRVVPIHLHPRTVCMRLELYGCTWTDGVITYNMPQGEKRGLDQDLFDFTYDGSVTDTGHLIGGLGQLTDGIEGSTNFRLDTDSRGKKGYEWIGWRNDSQIDRPPVEMTFTFDTRRSFTSVGFHLNNMFTKDVRLFRKVAVYFSSTPDSYPEWPVVFECERDSASESARFVTVPIPGRVGRFVKAQLYFGARWMMLSEVRFNSVVFSEKVERMNDTFPITIIPVFDHPADSSSNSSANPAKLFYQEPLDGSFIMVVLGCSVVTAILFTTAVVLLAFRCNRSSARLSLQCGESTGDPCQNCRLSRDTITEKLISEKRLIRHSEGGAMSVEDEELQSIGRIYGEPVACIQARKLPDLPPLPPVDLSDFYSDTNTSTYAYPQRLNVCHLGQGTPLTTERRSISPPPLQLSFKSDPVGENKLTIQGCTGNSLYGIVATPGSGIGRNVPSLTMPGSRIMPDRFAYMELSREDLMCIEKLGEGPNGEVHLCEMLTPLDETVKCDCKKVSHVVVKLLNKNVNERARTNFYEEVNTLSILKHENIIRMIGVCCRDEPLCIVTEYLEHGDLKQFLQNHASLEHSMADEDKDFLSYGCLLYMATQIASGMSYLESINLIHRDLATRNCLVGARLAVKLSDFGMSRILHSADYYRVHGLVVLPIRWMSWEAVLMGKFSSRSDVWSFAVTLWELLTFARCQPFSEFDDEQVIENCRQFYLKSGDSIDDEHVSAAAATAAAAAAPVLLCRPPDCPPEIYDLMLECWNSNALLRPSFQEIHEFLQNKNSGFRIEDELESDDAQEEEEEEEEEEEQIIGELEYGEGDGSGRSSLPTSDVFLDF